MANILHHHRYMRMMMLEWPDFPETVGENYCLETVKLIRTNPLKWLCSLPMVEYAHILEVFTAHHLGGEPTQYVKILYNRMFVPVLRKYYQELELYRFNRALVMRDYASMAKIKPTDGAPTLNKKMSLCTSKTRSLLCQICEDYHWMKDLGEQHPKVLWYIQKLEDLYKDTKLESWLTQLNEYVATIRNANVAGYPGTETWTPGEPTV